MANVRYGRSLYNKLFVSLPHRRNTTVSSETQPLFIKATIRATWLLKNYVELQVGHCTLREPSGKNKWTNKLRLIFTIFIELYLKLKLIYGLFPFKLPLLLFTSWMSFFKAKYCANVLTVTLAMVFTL